MFRKSFLRGLLFGGVIATAASIALVSKGSPQFKLRMTNMLKDLGRTVNSRFGQAMQKITKESIKQANMSDTSSVQTRGQLQAVVEGSKGIIRYTGKHMKRSINRLSRSGK